MQLSLTMNAINLLTHCLVHNGLKETDQMSKQEVWSMRTLNGVESAQRRHFRKSTDKATENYDAEVKKMREESNELIKQLTEKYKAGTEKEEGEKDGAFNSRINILVQTDPEYKKKIEELNKRVKELLETKYEFELTDQTFEVVKKYWKEYGDEIGFMAGDDAVVEEVNGVLEV